MPRLIDGIRGVLQRTSRERENGQDPGAAHEQAARGADEHTHAGEHTDADAGEHEKHGHNHC